MSLKLKQPTMRFRPCFFVNLVMRWNGHVFLNSQSCISIKCYMVVTGEKGV